MYLNGKPVMSISPDGQSITCSICAMTSHNHNDVENLYCASCHTYGTTLPIKHSTDSILNRAKEIVKEKKAQGWTQKDFAKALKNFLETGS